MKILCVFIFLLVSGTAHAANVLEYYVLRGVTAVNVEALEFAEQFNGQITPDVLKTIAELRLRKMDIPLVEDRFECLGLPNCVSFTIRLAPLRSEREGLYVYHLAISVSDWVQRVHSPFQRAFAIIWGKTVTGVIGKFRTDSIKTDVLELTDAFANDYLAANPPGRDFSQDLYPGEEKKK